MRFRILIIAILVLISNSARADLSSDLQSFWSDLGGTASSASTTAFAGQAATYYTLGNVRARTGTRSTSLTTFSLPSVEAGCGGIDFFTGSLSFISEEELVQLSKAIAQNAIGYAFDLALETISPVIAETMKDLRSRLQELNLNNINSCEAAKGIVNAVWPKHTAARDKICAEIGSNEGIFNDYADARHGCSTSSGQSDSFSAVDETKPEADFLSTTQNIAWKVMRSDRVSASDWLKSDNELAEIVQTLVGTVVVKDNNVNYYPAQGLSDRTVKAIMLGTKTADNSTKIRHYKCTGTSPHDECLEIDDDATLTINEDNGSIRGRVSTAIDALVNDIERNKVPDASNLAMVNRTTIPLWRILNVYAAYSGPIITSETDLLKDIVAVDLTLGYLSNLINEVLARSNSNELAGFPEVEAWIENVRDVQRHIRTQELQNHEKFQRAFQLVERVQLLEQHLASRLGQTAGTGVNPTTSSPRN